MSAEFKGSAPTMTSAAHSISRGGSSLGLSSEHSFSSRSLASFNTSPAIAVLDRAPLSSPIAPSRSPNYSKILGGENSAPHIFSGELHNDISKGRVEGRKALALPSLYEAPKPAVIPIKKSGEVPRTLSDILRTTVPIYEAPKVQTPTIRKLDKNEVSQAIKNVESKLTTLWQSPRIEQKPLKVPEIKVVNTTLPEQLQKMVPSHLKLEKPITGISLEKRPNEQIQINLHPEQKVTTAQIAKQREVALTLPLAKTTQELLIKAGYSEVKANIMVSEAVQAKVDTSVSVKQLQKTELLPQQKEKLEALQKTTTKTETEKKENMLRKQLKYLFIKDMDAAAARKEFIERGISIALSHHKDLSSGDQKKKRVISGKEIVKELPGQIAKIKSQVLKFGNPVLDMLTRADRSWSETRTEIGKIVFDSRESASDLIEHITAIRRPVTISIENENAEVVTDAEVKLVLDKPKLNVKGIAIGLLAVAADLAA